ncbi:endonuclease-reverse transcriptase [Elysia marginata]|uniref:Endonuclease-reverse transcriptase n=1 Tax=Elysia marginata TaxID=1093978 RepID=A0AAV4HQZ4_9GAST|nr:endonuclease-reverse transcriptase [Elysia marginata]
MTTSASIPLWIPLKSLSGDVVMWLPQCLRKLFQDDGWRQTGLSPFSCALQYISRADNAGHCAPTQSNNLHWLRPICNLRFADDIDLIAGSQAELQVLTDRLVASSKAFGMEVSSEKSKVMVSSERVNDASITMDDKPLELVHKFKYLGALLHEDGSSTVEVRTRIALATAAFVKLGKIWKSSISFKAKHKLFRSLVSSILTYGCETWTLLADTERRIQAFENKCLRKLLRISYKDHLTNESVRELVVAYVDPQEPLLATVKRRKLAWFGHVTRHDSLSKTILQGTVEGKRRRGRQR